MKQETLDVEMKENAQHENEIVKNMDIDIVQQGKEGVEKVAEPEVVKEVVEKPPVEKKKEEKKVKKTEAVARGRDLPVSKKHSMEIIRFIKGKKIDEAMLILQRVLKKKQAIPFRGYEIPHRKGKGISEGRYPRNASKAFIQLLKSLQANASIGNVDLDKAVLSGKANDASRPYKRGGSMRFKRTHVEVWIREPMEKKKLEKSVEVKK